MLCRNINEEQGNQEMQPQRLPNSSCGTYTLLCEAHYHHSSVEEKHLESTSLASYTFITLQMEKLLQSHGDKISDLCVWLAQIHIKFVENPLNDSVDEYRKKPMCDRNIVDPLAF